MSARKPTARLYSDGGGVVTGTHDVELARTLILAEDDEHFGDIDNPNRFPADRAVITRGRIVHCLPGSYGDGQGWAWQFHPGEGRGSTPAVEWASR